MFYGLYYSGPSSLCWKQLFLINRHYFYVQLEPSCYFLRFKLFSSTSFLSKISSVMTVPILCLVKLSVSLFIIISYIPYFIFEFSQLLFVVLHFLNILKTTMIIVGYSFYLSLLFVQLLTCFFLLFVFLLFF